MTADERPPLALIVEDDRNIRRSVRATLESGGWRIAEAETLAQARAEVEARRFDLYVVDLGLPDGDGSELVRAVRQRTHAPIIVLSARLEEEQKVRSLDAGADDYVEKPFRVAEFLARVRAHVRRHAGAVSAANEGVRSFGDVEVDPGARTVTKAGRPVHLTATQHRLLAMLVANAGRVLTHRQLLREVWGPNSAEHTHYLRIYMAQLRHKLEDDPARPTLLLTETGIGYRLAPP